MPLLLVVKSRYTVAVEHSGLSRFLSDSMSPMWEADVALYEPHENLFLLYSRDPKTGLRRLRKHRGNRAGLRHSETFDPTGLDSTDAQVAVAAMLRADATPPVMIDFPFK